MSRKLQYQAPAPTTLAILLFAVIYLLRVGVLPFGVPNVTFEGNALVSPPFIQQAIATFEAQNPIWAIVIGLLLITTGAIRTMNITSKYNLFSQVTHLPAMLYPIPFAMWATPAEIIAPAATGVVMTFAMDGLFGGYNHVDGGSKIFRGSFYLGIIPLIYPAMAVLVLALVAVVMLLDRGGRDIILIVGGAITPLMTYLYIYWLGGESFADTWSTLCSAFVAQRWYISHEWGVVATATIVALLAIFAAIRIDNISITLVSRTRITFCSICVVIAAVAMISPSFSAPQLSIAAMPMAIALTAALYELPVRASTICYMVLIVLMMLVRVLP